LAGTVEGVLGELAPPSFSPADWERLKKMAIRRKFFFQCVVLVLFYCYFGVIFLQKYGKKREKWMGRTKPSFSPADWERLKKMAIRRHFFSQCVILVLFWCYYLQKYWEKRGEMDGVNKAFFFSSRLGKIEKDGHTVEE
jgi:hypothetical protein